MVYCCIEKDLVFCLFCVIPGLKSLCDSEGKLL